MFGRKKDPKPPSRRAGQSLAQYGLFDVPDNLDDMGGPSDEGDSDLEAELAAIAGAGGRAKSKPKPKARALPQVDLDNLVAASLRDIPSDEEMSDGDEDPDLLNELSELAGEEPAPEAPVPSRPAPPPPGPPAASGTGEQVALLKERIQMYTLAEENAKSSGESSRARRLNRGIKTLKDQLKQAMAGKIVNEEDIPPAVSTSKHTTPAPAPPPLTNETEDIKAELPEPPQPAALTPESPKQATPPPAEEPSAVNELSDEAKATLNVLNERKNQYKLAALTAKREGDNALALSYVKILKEFDRVGGAVRAGQAVDLSNMPGPPGEAPPGPPPLPLRQEEHVQMSTDDPSAVSEDTISTNETLISASSIEEALQQRLDLYRQQESVAKEAGNTSKARRMGRIVKQFEGAMKQHRAGRAIPYDELPTPPGYAPIPGAPPPPKEDPAPETSEAQPPPASDESPAPEASGGPRTGAPGTAGRSNSVRRMGNQLGTGLASQQLTALLQRQREFKEAALEAKKKGELSEAKEFLRCAKGFDPLIDAARGGLPVDLSSVPIPPQAKQQLEDSYDIINSEDCGEGQEEGVLGRLEQQLAEQLRLCLETGEHHRAMGDVSGANRFQHLALAVKQDIDVVKMAKRLGSKSVKFHYETKQFSIVQCCTDLGDNDLELTIVRGISYTVPNPKEIDTYVKFEFPYPQEEPVQDKTALVKDTNSPEYNAVFTIPIHRTRPCLRIFKRQAVKLELYSRGGFFSRDTLIATATVKLQPLETQTVLHDSFDLMNGRKLVGGKLEVKIRVRNPMLTKQIEQSTKKWLIIDH